MTTYTQEQVIEMLRREIGGKTQKDMASELGITQSYLCDILRGRRNPGKAVLDFLGMEETYSRVKRQAVTKGSK